MLDKRGGRETGKLTKANLMQNKNPYSQKPPMYHRRTWGMIIISCLHYYYPPQTPAMLY